MRRLAESLRFLNQIRLILAFLRKEPEYQVIAYRIKRMIFPTAVISCSRVFYAGDATKWPIRRVDIYTETMRRSL